ncbi:MAG: hypothetical protein K6G10_03440 [Butyrivibrio sp.]|nr:hypothetical protein [Butyrivibrio sp.]
MIIFIYTFGIIFVALTVIFGIGSLLDRKIEEPSEYVESEATAAMCTTQLLGSSGSLRDTCDEDFVIEQDLVYTYDSVNL